MDFRKRFMTSVAVHSSPQKIVPEDSLFFMGSCFADNLCRIFSERFLQAEFSPFGMIYNPLSLARLLGRICQPYKYTAQDLFFHNELWRNFDFHTRKAGKDKHEVLDLCNRSIDESRSFLKRSRFLFLTLGTAHGFFLKEDSPYPVNNCHRLPGNRFQRRLLSLKQMLSTMKQALESVLQLNPDIEIVVTISPVRYLNGGAQENSLSKSLLRILAERLKEELPVYYFPAYEIVLDELRDYRWFESDLNHPTKAAVNYVFERFLESYGSEELALYLPKAEKIMKGMRHLPENADSECEKQRQNKLAGQWENLVSEYDFLAKKKVKIGQNAL